MFRPTLGAHSATYSIGNGFLPEDKSDWGVMLPTHLHLVPRLRECSYTSTSPTRLRSVDWDKFTFNLLFLSISYNM